jgi:hypothetical protein
MVSLLTAENAKYVPGANSLRHFFIFENSEKPEKNQRPGPIRKVVSEGAAGEKKVAAGCGSSPQPVGVVISKFMAAGGGTGKN